MVIIDLGDPTKVEIFVAAALACDMAVEISPGQVRLITEGEHAVELDQLGDRLFEALEHRAGPEHPDGIPGPTHFSGSLIEQETQCPPSEPCTSATISPDGTMTTQPQPRLTA